MNVEMALHSPYLPPPDGINHIYQNRRNTFDINNKNLSSTADRLRIAEHCYKRTFASVAEIPKPLVNWVPFYMSNNNFTEGFVLSPPSMLVIYAADGRLYHLY